jgi:hypothetical protein
MKNSHSHNGKAPKSAEKDLAASYNKFKTFDGKQYTGMKIGRSHKWNYDSGVWKETKLTPDLWGISFSVKKRRAGHAPKGSGVPVGTEYHWYILAHQNVKKFNANIYTTEMEGLKYKLAHRRADKDKWSTTEDGQRKRLIKFLEETIEHLKKDGSEMPVATDGQVNGKKKSKASSKKEKIEVF